MSKLRGVATPPADQLVLELPGMPPNAAVQHGPVRRARLPRQRWSAAAVPTSGYERVWLVWEDNEVLGVYGDPAVAATDLGILRRNALRAGTAIDYECLPVPVFANARHHHGR